MAASKATYLVDVDRETGEFISGWPRIKQSIVTILTTRLDTRVMRLFWGSSFLDMQDKPINQETLTGGIVAAIQAINAYEPEFQVYAVEVRGAGSDGKISFTVKGVDLIQNQDRSITAPV